LKHIFHDAYALIILIVNKMELLPNDLINIIIKKIDLRSVVKLSQVNKFFYCFINKLQIMKQLTNTLLVLNFCQNIKINLINIFIKSCAEGHFELVKHLAKNEPYITEYVDENRHPRLKYYHCALRTCIEYNHIKITKFLIKYFKCDIPKSVFDIGDLDLIKFVFEEKIQKDNKMDLYESFLIEQYFNGASNFGRHSTCEISRNGTTAQEVYLKIVLPFDLESIGSTNRFNLLLHSNKESVLLKKNFIYSLINKIEIEIGGSSIVCYGGDELYKIDKINKSEEKIFFLCKINKNTIYYPINVQSIFRDTLSRNNNMCNSCPPLNNIGSQYEKHCDLKMHGLKLSRLQSSIFRINVGFGNVYDMIDHNSIIHNESMNIINDMELDDVSLLVRCISYYSPNYSLRDSPNRKYYYDNPECECECEIIQKINIWIKEEIHLWKPGEHNNHIELKQYTWIRDRNRNIVNYNRNHICKINQMILFVKNFDHTKIIDYYYLEISTQPHDSFTHHTKYYNKLNVIKSIYDPDSDCQLIYLDFQCYWEPPRKYQTKFVFSEDTTSINYKDYSIIYLNFEFVDNIEHNDIFFECLLNIDIVGKYNYGMFCTSFSPYYS
jgi:hypothetical protein